MPAKPGLTEVELLTVDAANGLTYAYRRFGDHSCTPPLVFIQHFRGNVDNWDPALIDGVAAHREVIRSTTPASAAAPGQPPTRSSRWHSTPSLSSTRSP
jgi:hypothetical protein